MTGWGEPLDRYAAHMRAGGARPGTVRLRLWHLNGLARTAPDPWAVTADDLVDYIGNERWAPEARKSARSAVRGFYRWAHASDRVEHDPSRNLPSVRVPAGVPRPTPESVFRAALDGCSDRERLMLMLAGYAGLRCMEIAAIRFEDIRGDELFVRGKGGRVRVVPLHPVLVYALDRERSLRRSGGIGSGWRFNAGQAVAEEYVFPGQSAGALTPWNVSTVLSRLLGPGFTGTPCGTDSPPRHTPAPATSGPSRRCWATRSRRPQRGTPGPGRCAPGRGGGRRASGLICARWHT